MRLKVNGIEIHFSLEGPEKAPVVTLSHSLATDLAMWNPQVPALSERYRVLRFDTRGHGETEAPGGAYTLEMLAEDARALLEALEIEATHFVGLSMGGMIGQMLALRYPELLLSLTLADTSSRVPVEARPLWHDRIAEAEKKGMEGLVEPTIGRWFTAPFAAAHPEVVDPVRMMIRRTNPRGFAGCGHAIKMLDLTDQLQAVRTQTLIIVGEDDPGTPVAAAKVIHERISGSNLVVIPKAAHLSNLEQPETFTRALLDFLTTQGG